MSTTASPITASPAPLPPGARGHLEGEYLQFGVGVTCAPATARELDAHLDRYPHALAPWAIGARFTSFAERHSSLETCVPSAALGRISRICHAVDPDRLLVAAHAIP